MPLSPRGPIPDGLGSRAGIRFLCRRSADGVATRSSAMRGFPDVGGGLDAARHARHRHCTCGAHGKHVEAEEATGCESARRRGGGRVRARAGARGAIEDGASRAAHGGDPHQLASAATEVADAGRDSGQAGQAGGALVRDAAVVAAERARETIGTLPERARETVGAARELTARVVDDAGRWPRTRAGRRSSWARDGDAARQAAESGPVAGAAELRGARGRRHAAGRHRVSAGSRALNLAADYVTASCAPSGRHQVLEQLVVEQIASGRACHRRLRAERAGGRPRRAACASGAGEAPDHPARRDPSDVFSATLAPPRRAAGAEAEGSPGRRASRRRTAPAGPLEQVLLGRLARGRGLADARRIGAVAERAALRGPRPACAAVGREPEEQIDLVRDALQETASTRHFF